MVFDMVTFVYRIASDGKRIHLTGGGALEEDTTENEMRIANCLDSVIRAAMTEILRHVDGGTLVETKMIPETAQEAIRSYLQNHPLE